MAELKPCPFCGEIPKYYQYGNEWCVECHSDKCWVVPETDLCSSKEEATEKWNARTPIADVVEVETIKAWLYELAINNVGCDGDFSKACEEIISRIDGLRNFAKERSGG